jgi:hypothetical protein
MNRREVLIAVAAATMAVAVSWAGTPAAPPPPPPVPMPAVMAKPWDAFCLSADKARVEQTWGNDDLDKEVGWNRVIRQYAASGYEPFQLLTAPSDTKRGVPIISAVCFKKPAG